MYSRTSTQAASGESTTPVWYPMALRNSCSMHNQRMIKYIMVSQKWERQNESKWNIPNYVMLYCLNLWNVLFFLIDERLHYRGISGQIRLWRTIDKASIILETPFHSFNHLAKIEIKGSYLKPKQLRIILEVKHCGTFHSIAYSLAYLK